MENRRRHSTGGSLASWRRLRYLLALAGDYLKYLFMKRRRLLHKVARRTLALVHRRHGERGNKVKMHHHPWPARALMEHEFSCADSPSPAFLAAKRLLLRSRQRGSGAAAAAAGAVSSCFGSFRAPFGSSPDGDETMVSETTTTEVGEEEDALETMTTEEEEDDQVLAADQEDGGWLQRGDLLDVDDRAEEFINMFYEQLRAQNFAAVFHYSP